MKVITSELITIKKDEQLKNRHLVAISGGKTFIKVLFLNKSNKEQLFNNNESSLMLELSTFHIEDFRFAIEWIREKAYISEDNTSGVCVTGSFSDEQINEIKSILNKEVLCKDEFQTTADGCRFALENIGVDSLTVQPVHIDSYENIDSDMIRNMMISWKNKFPPKEYATDVMHPCLVYVQGLTSTVYSFDKNGSSEIFRSGNLGSQTLMGLSKCLLNTNNLDELLELSSKGNKVNVDTQMKEIIDGNITSPYGKFPPEMPTFSFGKCMDYNLSLKEISKEDVANSLVGYFIRNILSSCSAICKSKRIPKVYLCGGIFQSESLRKELMRILQTPVILLKPDLLDFDYSAILGAMISNENNDKTCAKTPKVVLF